MNEAATQDKLEPEREVPRARVGRSVRVSIIWIVPIIAAGLALYLAWTSYAERGPTVTITFASAEGLSPGQTRIRYRDVEVGTVQGVRLSDDLRQIEVTAEMVQDAAPYMVTGTRFWIVRPRVGAAGVSGLGTLVSGAYMEVDPGQGEPTDEFVGLEEPPPISSDAPGRTFKLRAGSVGSVSRGAPLYYRGLDVGQVLGYELATDDQRRILVDVFVRSPYEGLVTPETRFWNASGLGVTTSGGALSVQLASVQALVAGGIEFETPRAALGGAAAPAGSEFDLFEDENAAQQHNFARGEPYLINFEGLARGLQEQAPVEVRGVPIGLVTGVRLAYSQSLRTLVGQVSVEITPGLIQAIDADTGAPIPPAPLEELVARGLRAQLKTGNLLTGDLYVDLDFYPDAAPAEVRRVGDLLVIPSVPTSLETLQASATSLLEKVARLPLEEIVGSLRNSAVALEGILAAPQTKDTVTSLRTTLDEVSRAVGPLVTTVQGTAAATTQTMQQARETLQGIEGSVGPQAPLQDDLRQLMGELQDAARSIRVLADYIERNPEALIRGRTGSYR